MTEPTKTIINGQNHQVNYINCQIIDKTVIIIPKADFTHLEEVLKKYDAMIHNKPLKASYLSGFRNLLVLSLGGCL